MRERLGRAGVLCILWGGIETEARAPLGRRRICTGSGHPFVPSLEILAFLFLETSDNLL